MVSIRFVLLVLAFVCFLLAAAEVSGGRVNLIAAGLAAWVGSLLF